MNLRCLARGIAGQQNRSLKFTSATIKNAGRTMIESYHGKVANYALNTIWNKEQCFGQYLNPKTKVE